VSQYRDSLPEAQRGAFDACISAAAQICADACARQAHLGTTRGTRAVAEAAWYPGHPLGSVEAIQARYEELLDEARRGHPDA
jgi:hypothetical protein